MNTWRVALTAIGVVIVFGGCRNGLPNSPYPQSEALRNIYYTSYSEPPKTLDPAVSYSSDQYRVLGPIYEPPLQYHILSQQIVPATATEVPQPRNQGRVRLNARISAVGENGEVTLDLGTQSGVKIGHVFAVKIPARRAVDANNNPDDESAEPTFTDVPARVIGVGEYRATALLERTGTDSGDPIAVKVGLDAVWTAPTAEWKSIDDFAIRHHLATVSDRKTRLEALKAFAEAVAANKIVPTEPAEPISETQPVQPFAQPEAIADFSMEMAPGWKWAPNQAHLIGPSGAQLSLRVETFEGAEAVLTHPSHPERDAFLRRQIEALKQRMDVVTKALELDPQNELMPGHIVAGRLTGQPTRYVQVRFAERNRHLVLEATGIAAEDIDAVAADVTAMAKTAWSMALSYPFEDVRVIYDIRIQPGIFYAPHPCFARQLAQVDPSNPETLKILAGDNDRPYLYHAGIRDFGTYGRLRALRDELQHGKTESAREVRQILDELAQRGVTVTATIEAVNAKLTEHGRLLTAGDMAQVWDIGDFNFVREVGVILDAEPAVLPETLVQRAEALRAEMKQLLDAKKFEDARAKHAESVASAALGRRLRWQAAEKTLVWQGRMRVSERDELMALAPSVSVWRDTVQYLFLRSQEVATRELVAADYVFQIKRLANPQTNCPIFSVVATYVRGMEAYMENLNGELEAERARRQARAGLAYSREVDERENPIVLDLDAFEFPGLEVVDDYTYRITLTQPWPQLKYWLAMPFFAPIPWEAELFFNQTPMFANDLTLSRFPVGTGPYRLAVYDRTREMRLVRNENFRREWYPLRTDYPGDPTYPSEADVKAGLLEDEGRLLPMIDEIVFKMEREALPMWNKFMQGYYDASGVSEGIFESTISIRGDAMGLSDDMRTRGIRLGREMECTLFYFGFNMRDPIVGGYTEDKQKLRQAISIALDMEEFIDIFANGRHEPAHGPIPPMVLDPKYFGTDYNQYVYDWDAASAPWRPEISDKPGKPTRKSIDEAKRLLAEAGYPDGKDSSGRRLIVHFDSSWVSAALGPRLDWLTKRFDMLGIEFVSRATDYTKFQEKMETGQAQMFFWGWHNDYPDPENNLFLLYGPNHRTPLPWSPHKGENAANYDNSRFNDLFEQMETMPDDFDGNRNGIPDRVEIIREMVEILRQDAPWIFAYHPVSLNLYHRWLYNTKHNPNGNNELKYRRIEAADRQDYREHYNQPLILPAIILGLFLLLAVIPAMVMVYLRETRPMRA